MSRRAPLAAQALSIFGDHADVMAVRATGFALLSAHNTQEAQDLALIAHAATLRARVPFVHFFDGYRTSHEIRKIAPLADEVLRAMIDDDLVRAHRARALSPDRPSIRGTAQNPDVYFQARETVNPFYQACPAIVQQTMDQFATLTGRQYHLFDYVGAPDAERVLIADGLSRRDRRGDRRRAGGAWRAGRRAQRSTCTARSRSRTSWRRCRRPCARSPCSIAPRSPAASASRCISMWSPPLRKVKRKKAKGKPSDDNALFLYLYPFTFGRRRSLWPLLQGVTPAMVKGVFDELAKPAPKNHFTLGIDDDVSHTSLAYDPAFSIEAPETVRGVFWGLGADGTVGANKESIKIIGEETDNFAQGYFVYDSKKSGSVTISHLRFGPRPIRAPYLIGPGQADLRGLPPVLIPRARRRAQLRAARRDLPAQQPLRPRGGLAAAAARGAGRDRAQSAALLRDRRHRRRPRGRHGRADQHDHADGLLRAQRRAAARAGDRSDQAQHQESLRQARRGGGAAATSRPSTRPWRACMRSTTDRPTERSRIEDRPPADLCGARQCSDEAPEFVRRVLGPIIAGAGDTLPVSALPIDGTYPSGTAQWEKRNIALEIPVWDPELCIQCGKCAFVCPHAVIRTKVYEPSALADAPEAFLSAGARFKEFPGMRYTLQISPEDCTSCGLCVEACPAKDKRQVGRKAIMMAEQPPIREREKLNWEFFLGLPEVDRTQVNLGTIKNCAADDPAVRVLGRLRGLRRDALHQAGHAAVRRPHDRGQRHRLLIDLRRQPADDALDVRIGQGVGRRGPTRCSRTTPSSAWACA